MGLRKSSSPQAIGASCVRPTACIVMITKEMCLQFLPFYLTMRRLELEHSFLFWFIQRDTESFGQKVEKNYRIEHLNSLSAWYCFRSLIQHGWFIKQLCDLITGGLHRQRILAGGFLHSFCCKAQISGWRQNPDTFKWEVRHGQNKGSD